ncbi:FMN-linked oxidoreductase [Cylindrobasidium torrendii FP15055 ss-10]|uniref:FMN-linked oxidoreductase n=1 Tax=Cylindrobasidium torrendii FP15055 ss-10 TaxID=1314674 RepID=A0A0D7BST3_9AGAR|nr:FMN-linked oxidoreductase [Cylindrobasidium torrendii FP15055 ss-10]
MSIPKALFQPLQVGPLTLKNRVGMAAMTRNRSTPTSVPNDLNIEYYRQRAAGGAGLIVSEGTLISPQGSEWPNAPGIWSDAHIDGWSRVTAAVHQEGGKIYSQLWHLGRVNHPDAPEHKKSGDPVYAPSAIAARGGKFSFLPGAPGYVTPTPVEDPATLLPAWRQAALNAQEAGFDGVEVHGANGYLISQFLDSTSNKRTDKWGGSVENRSRFGLEVLREVCDVWGPEQVAIKLNPCGGYNDVGMPLEETKETYSHFITEADKMKLGYICLVRYAKALDQTVDGKLRGTKHDVLSTYAPLIKHARKFANAGFSGAEAEKVVAQGLVDGVFFGIPWVSNPDFAERLERGKKPNMAIDFAALYANGAKGYIDYPEID